MWGGSCLVFQERQSVSHEEQVDLKRLDSEGAVHKNSAFLGLPSWLKKPWILQNSQIVHTLVLRSMRFYEKCTDFELIHGRRCNISLVNHNSFCSFIENVLVLGVAKVDAQKFLCLLGRSSRSALFYQKCTGLNHPRWFESLGACRVGGLPPH